MHPLAPPPPLPPGPETATPIEASFCTLTHRLDLILRHPRQGARGFECKAQLLSQNTRWKWNLGTAAMATIGNAHKPPIGSHLVAAPQDIGIAMTTRRWRPGRGRGLTPLILGLSLGTRRPFDPVHTFAFAQISPHLSGR